MKYTILLAALFLGGCVTTEEIQQRDLGEAATECSSFGYQRGTQAYAQCMQLSYARKQQVRDRASAAASAALIQQGARIYHGPPRVDVYNW